MSRLWEDCNHNINLFLFIHTLLGAVYGICAWSVISLFALKSVTWMLCFGGYGAFFVGFVGGILFVWEHTGKNNGSQRAEDE